MDAPPRPVILIPGDDPPQIADTPALERLQSYGDVRLYRDRPSDDAEKVRRAADADVILNSRGQVSWPGHVLRQLPKLRMITACGIGVDAFDLATAAELGLRVCNVPGRTAPIVAEHALGLLLAVSRHTAFLTAELKAGRWTQRMATWMGGKTLGVIGTGSIGCELIRLARACGMRVVAWSFHPDPAKAERLDFEYLPLDDLLRQSTAISLHVKLTAESRHLIGPRELALLPEGAFLVNTSRGAVVQTEALVEALQSGRLGGAGLDVFEQEPLPPDHPLLSCPQVVLTPHSADQVPEGMELLNEGAVENVIAFLRGTPQNVII